MSSSGITVGVFGVLGDFAAFAGVLAVFTGVLAFFVGVFFAAGPLTFGWNIMIQYINKQIVKN